MSKKVSIVIPVYNVENYIKKSLDSIINQTFNFNDIEVIMVDDCSTDNSGIIIDEYASKYDNFKSIHLDENSGAAGKPRNVGLNMASSEFVMFLDSDDCFRRDAIEKLYRNILRDNELDIVLGGYKNIYENNKTEIILPSGNFNESLFEDTKRSVDLIKINPAISAKLFRRSLLLKNNITFPEGIPGQDLVFILNSFFNARKVLSLNNFIVYNRFLRFTGINKSISLNITQKYLLGLIKAYSLTLNVCMLNKIDLELTKLILIHHLQFFNNQILRKGFSLEELSMLFNSSVFNEFKSHEFFDLASEFKLIFDNIENKNYYNGELIKYIRLNVENNVFYKYKDIKSILNQYKLDNEILIKNLRVKEAENYYLKKKNKELNLEITGIHSSKFSKINKYLKSYF